MSSVVSFWRQGRSRQGPLPAKLVLAAARARNGWRVIHEASVIHEIRRHVKTVGRWKGREAHSPAFLRTAAWVSAAKRNPKRLRCSITARCGESGLPLSRTVGSRAYPWNATSVPRHKTAQVVRPESPRSLEPAFLAPTLPSPRHPDPSPWALFLILLGPESSSRAGRGRRANQYQ